MNAAEKLILEYETLRREISILKAERSELIYKCKNIKIVSVNGFQETQGNICLVKYWAASELPPRPFDDECNHDYSETLEEFGCEVCNESFAIKRGPLAKAKHELGNVKRKISSLGKKLIKEDAE